MPRRSALLASTFALAVGALLSSTDPARAQIGLVLTGAGPVNRSMGGAAVAAPLDATGALYWNPATTSALPDNSIDFGIELLVPQTHLASSLPANALGLGLPPVPLAGSDRGDDGVFALPSMALVYHPEGSPWTLGLGIFPIGGFGVNYPASTSNPILTAQPPNGLGLGPIYSDLQIIQLAPAVSVQLTDQLSFGIGPTVNLANLSADPAIVTAPNLVNGFPEYPPATHTRMAWGAGFQAGLYYIVSDDWQVGASIKSPQWFEDFHYQTTDGLGRPREFTAHFDFPMIVSAGLAYTGFDRWVLAADFRYVDFRNTEGFRQSGFDATGAVQGLGWRSVFAVALGAQYRLTDALSVRLGYSYNQDPISDSQSSFNVASSTILEHAIYCGFSYQVTGALSLSAAYAHGFENSVEGPLVTPLGAVPGSAVRNTTSADTFLVGASVKFGGCPPRN
jgi:long-chain fatty acid transport protein